MKRRDLLAIPILALAVSAGTALAQEDVDNDDLNLTVRLEDASQSGAAASNLQLPIDERTRATAPASEQGRRFQSADFARPNRLEALQIAADDLPRRRPVAAVRCQAFISRDGSLGEYFCISDDNYAYRDVVTAVILAVPTQGFVAARVDGESVRVLMNFAVYVDCSSGSCFAVAARNHGYHAEQLGLDYVDPQPILEGDEWYEGFDYKLRWVRDWMPRITTVDRWDAYERLPYVMAVPIDATGIAAPGCLSWVDALNFSNSTVGAPARAPVLPTRTIRALERAVASLGNVRYLPGMVDEIPTTLSFYEQSVTRFQFDGMGQGLALGFGLGAIDCTTERPRRELDLPDE